MGKHATHRIHQNTRTAWRSFDQGTRQREVCEVLERYGELTDREVCYKLGSRDMNYARPAITKLIEEKIVEERGKTVCETTGRRVRVVGLRWNGGIE